MGSRAGAAYLNEDDWRCRTEQRRIEEELGQPLGGFDGDLKNLRGRFPLAAIGALTILPKAAVDRNLLRAFADMMTKLVAPERPWVNAYDAACIIVCNWEGKDASHVPILNPDLEGDERFPSLLQPNTFFNELLNKVLERAPVAEHELARGRRDQAKGVDPSDLEAAAAFQAAAGSVTRDGDRGED